LQLQADMEKTIDDRLRVLKKTITTDSERYVNKTLKLALEVPGLLGENEQFSTLSNLLTTMNTKVNMQQLKLNQKFPGYDNSIQQLQIDL